MASALPVARFTATAAIRKAMQDVEGVGLGGDAVLKGQLHRAQHCLLVVLQHQGKNVHHLPVASWSLQHLGLQPTGCFRHLVNGAAGNVMRALDDAGVLAHDLPRGHHDQSIGINPQAHRPFGEP